MTNFKIAEDARNGMMDELITQMGAGAAAARLKIYDGAQPAGGGAATTLLADIELADPAAPAAAGGVATLTMPQEDASADATGTATWFRIEDSDGNWVCDGDVTATGGDGDLKLATTDLAAGQTVEITSFTLTAPNAA